MCAFFSFLLSLLFFFSRFTIKCCVVGIICHINTNTHLILWMAHVRVCNWHTTYLNHNKQQIAYTCIRLQNPINITMVMTAPALTLNHRFTHMHTQNESEKVWGWKHQQKKKKSKSLNEIRFLDIESLNLWQMDF